ncbi:Gfo/Idh/MocA family protein [Mechercharimyces sp. CAU 1602]|uniref:Gfo/Idh/MocA family protein n=1 Tax=Mechercharimyces sp. CAU 1602 TaxID=2973933 RepID=UPI0021632EFC|nr:Gfo/Idh/MocA family oxidoreductase [Mechercharimyces sp. CAU 1602]MCS1351091.1 Gfo/Idh/MocA family oxidoreductase [Mechercharimyces sp. CAU 1602]
MEKLRVGIIGTGFGAQVHVPVFQSHPGFEVRAISSVYRLQHGLNTETGLKDVYREGIKVYTDWKKMMESEQLDLVTIVSNPSHHYEMTLAAIEMGYHVLCEKPMALHSQQSQEMIDALTKQQRVGAINFEFRTLPARKKVKEIIEEQRLGKILHSNYFVSRGGYLPAIEKTMGWLGQADVGGGLLGALGSHMIDSLLWWMDEDIIEVSGQLTTHIENDRQMREQRTADDTFQAMGRFAGGATFSFGLLRPSRDDRRTQLEIYGTEGTVLVNDDETVLFKEKEEPYKELSLASGVLVPDHLDNEMARSHYDIFYPFVEELHTCITERKSSSLVATFQDGHRVQQVIDAIKRSNETGMRQTLKY